MDKVRYGVSRDLAQLKEGASASAAELREFLNDMKGKDPHEVLGLIAQSSFVQALAVAAIGTVALLIVGTVVPYALYSGKKEVTTATGAVAPGAPGPAAAAPVNGATGGGAAGATGPGATPGAQPAMSELGGPRPDFNGDQPGGKKGSKGGDVLEKLGLGEDKMADPNVNPLDKGDDLLKGLN